MMKRMPRFDGATLALLMVALVFSGCDTLDPGTEEIVVTHEQEFRFEATRAQLTGGEVLTAGTPLDVAPSLEDLGFARGDIIGAEVVGAELSRTTPVGRDLNEIISGASVRLRTSGAELQVAETITVGSGSSIPMDTAPTDVGAMVRASPATVLLEPDAAANLGDDANYVFRVRLTVRLALEGI